MPIDITKNFVWRQVARRPSGSFCAKGSIRTKRISKKLLIEVCCPKGKYRGGRCAVGMKAVRIGRKR